MLVDMYIWRGIVGGDARTRKRGEEKEGKRERWYCTFLLRGCVHEMCVYKVTYFLCFVYFVIGVNIEEAGVEGKHGESWRVARVVRKQQRTRPGGS